MYHYYLVKCIIPICVFTATTTHGSFSCPHYHGSTAIPQILSPSQWYYRGFYPYSCRNTAVIVLINAVITEVNVVLPPYPSPCRSLLQTVKSYNSVTTMKIEETQINVLYSILNPELIWLI